MKRSPPSARVGIRLLSRVTGLIVSLLLSAASATSTVNPVMLGEWKNETEGHLMGIHLQEDDNCTLYVERFLQPRSLRDCRYELFSSRYLVYLKDAQGKCDGEPDFEFTFHEHEPLLRFYVGGNEIVMHKQPAR